EITLNFIRNLPKGKNRIVLMNTRAGIKLSKFIIPGLTGTAFMLAAAILKNKGYTIAGQIPFDMPSNWISIHPALRSRQIEFILTKNHDKVITHFERLNAGETDFASNKDIVQDILISPVALAYYFIGRYFFAKSYYASDQCIHCDLCIKECPVKAIEKVEGRPYWTFRCENCMRCMNNCPTNAIETTHGLWIIILLLTPVVCSLLYYGILPTSFHHGLAHFILFNFIFLALITLLYRIQQMALKNNICSKIISWMSLTHYKFWGRYKCK
uniref:EFR1 family ferrodoxin n=1 Tax=Macellibacteroides fermentans TaxID=879969 RepID=UPI00406CAC4D